MSHTSTPVGLRLSVGSQVSTQLVANQANNLEPFATKSVRRASRESAQSATRTAITSVECSHLLYQRLHCP